MPDADECVKVVVRVRPLSRKEQQDGHAATTVADEATGTITSSNPKADASDPPKSFTFDAVFAAECKQKSIYEKCGATVVEAVLNGYNGTIFAYGQTGAGKTFTMEGVADPPSLRGIIPNAFQHIFDKVAVAEERQHFLVRASYLEIYNEEIRDLLCGTMSENISRVNELVNPHIFRSKEPKNRLDLKENVDSGVYVKNLTSFVVKSSHEIDQVMQAGKKNRSVGATLMNSGSSRSHAIFTIIVECAEVDELRGEHIRVGKLNLVDLAGSERQAKTGATGDRLKEATKINLSLSALGNVISALVDGKSQHIPYRDSKLTRLLQDSLGGNTKTVMCANCGPAGYNFDETISTLRYANRAKNIKNKPKINEDPKDAMLREFQDEIKRLKQQLLGQGNQGGRYSGDGIVVMEERVIEKVVEVEKIVKVQGAATAKELADLKAAADEETEKMRRQAEAEMKEVLDSQTRTTKEQEKLRQRLGAEANRAAQSEKQRCVLEEKLKSMQEKLMRGGKLLDRAAKQEAMLRRAQLELQERNEQEQALSRQIRMREEGICALEEKYASKQDEADDKTRKLKKLWLRLQTCQSEAHDLQEEFQREREDMLDTIRKLSRQLKLKELMILNFVPSEEERRLEHQASWNSEEDDWVIPDIDLGGNSCQGGNMSDGTQWNASEGAISTMCGLTSAPCPFQHYTDGEGEGGKNKARQKSGHPNKARQLRGQH